MQFYGFIYEGIKLIRLFLLAFSTSNRKDSSDLYIYEVKKKLLKTKTRLQ